MVIRFRVETNCPTQHLNLHVSSVSPLPKSYRDAFNNLNCQNSMCDKYNALIRNNTWTIVPRPTDTNIVRCIWIFRHKYLADGTLSRYITRLVVNGGTRLEGIYVDETFSPVVKPVTIRTILSSANSRHWPIHQLDVKNAFLHGDLSATVYMHQPLGFRDSENPDYVCLLQRSLYGLKQALRAWFQRFASYITRVGFHHSRRDSSLFIYIHETDTAYLLLYIDDIVLTASSETLLQQIIMMFLSQRNYTTEILERAGMVSCNSNRTPVETESKRGDDGSFYPQYRVFMPKIEKKRMRLRTNTKTLEDLCSQSLKMASQAIHDAVTPHQVTASQYLRRSFLSSIFSPCYLFRNPFSSNTMRDENHLRTLGDYSIPSHEGYRNTIELPEGNNVPGKAITLPQDVPSTSDRRLIELENQVQRLMEAHLTPTRPNQVNKITTQCEICSGLHDTQNCMETPEQAFVDYASSHINEMGSKRTQLEQQQQDDMIGKINLLWKMVFEKLNNVFTPKNVGTPMVPKSIAANSHDEREELRKKGIKSPSKLLSPKYLSPSEFETDEEVEGIFDDEEKDEGDESFNLFPTMKELSHHEWLLKHPRTSWVKAKVRARSSNNIKISYMIGHIFKRHAYIDLESPINIMYRHQYNKIMTYRIRSRQKTSKPDKISNFVGRVKHIKFFIGSLTYECDFMILEDTSSIIDRHLGEMVFRKPFIDKTGLVYSKENWTIMFKQGDEKITFKMPYTTKIFKQIRLMGFSTDSIPPSANEENFGHEKTHYYQSLLIEEEY
nr:ribonuclease H-like domain-containing protein [Tanacetum cinerariifolium]